MSDYIRNVFIISKSNSFSREGWTLDLNKTHLNMSHAMVVEIGAGCEAFTANITLCKGKNTSN